METFGWVAGVAILAAVVNGMGILAVVRSRKWVKERESYFMCFAAGVLVAAPLLFMLPNAFKKSPRAGIFALIGFLFLFLSNRIIDNYTKKDQLTFGVVAALGIGIHSFVDGVVYAITFQASVLMGVVAAIGMIAHELSEGVITYVVLSEAGVKQHLVHIYALFIASLTTPLGAFIAYPFVSKLNQSALGLAIGFSAGAVMYVGASHLLPEATERGKQHSLIAFAAGVLVATLIVITKTL